MTEAPTLRLTEIAAAPGPLPVRATRLLAERGQLVPFDASWIALAEPGGTGYTSLARTSMDGSNGEHLSGPQNAREQCQESAEVGVNHHPEHRQPSTGAETSSISRSNTNTW